MHKNMCSAKICTFTVIEFFNRICDDIVGSQEVKSQLLGSGAFTIILT